MPKNDKKMLYDRKICPKLTEAETRCNECMFWHDDGFKHLDFMIVGDCPWDFTKFLKKGEKTDRDTLMVVKMAGCEVLLEICPDCLIIDNMRRQASCEPKLVGVNDYWHVTDNPEVQKLIPNPEDPKMLWCPQCQKVFHHKDVAHAINSMKITKARFPGLLKLTSE